MCYRIFSRSDQFVFLQVNSSDTLKEFLVLLFVTTMDKKTFVPVLQMIKLLKSGMLDREFW